MDRHACLAVDLWGGWRRERDLLQSPQYPLGCIISRPKYPLHAHPDGGIWSSTNGGTSWTNHNTHLSITQFYDGSLHPTDPHFALAGSQDNGTEQWTGTHAWQWIFGGDGADNAISSSHPNTHWAVSFQRLNIRRTTDGGASFTTADTGIDHTNAPFI